MGNDPRILISREPMHYRQILTIVIAATCAAIEGFDVYSISFASPGIAAAWGIDKATLGVVLSMELVGMGIGAFLLGSVADRAGRRPTILGCLVVMATGMWLASLAPDVLTLSAVRLYTGFGIGGLLATSSAIVAECVNDRHRSLAITLMIGGYSFGAVVGGAGASTLLANAESWQSIFELGAFATTLVIIPVFFLLPESVAYLCQRQPKNALSRVNQILVQQGRQPVDRLPERTAHQHGNGVSALFQGQLIGTTIALTLAFFMYMVTLYFLMKWIPKLVADMGYAASSAGRILVWANVGGLIGTIVIGLLMQKYPLRSLVIGALLCGGGAVVIFGQSPEGLMGLTVVAAAVGFFVIGANSGFYAIVAQSFPSQLRAGGTGFVIGAGRAGSAAGPIVAGLLFQAGWTLATVSAVMACGCVLAALAIGSIRWLNQ